MFLMLLCAFEQVDPSKQESGQEEEKECSSFVSEVEARTEASEEYWNRLDGVG